MKSLTDQIACVKREIGMRERVYQRRVACRQMKQDQADHEIECMRAVLQTLLELSEDEFRLG